MPQDGMKPTSRQQFENILKSNVAGIYPVYLLGSVQSEKQNIRKGLSLPSCGMNGSIFNKVASEFPFSAHINSYKRFLGHFDILGFQTNFIFRKSWVNKSIMKEAPLLVCSSKQEERNKGQKNKSTKNGLDTINQTRA